MATSYAQTCGNPRNEGSVERSVCAKLVSRVLRRCVDLLGKAFFTSLRIGGCDDIRWTRARSGCAQISDSLNTVVPSCIAEVFLLSSGDFGLSYIE